METILENKSKSQGNNFKVKTLMEHNINFFANFFQYGESESDLYQLMLKWCVSLSSQYQDPDMV